MKNKHKLFLRRVLILGVFSGLLILGSKFLQLILLLVYQEEFIS